MASNVFANGMGVSGKASDHKVLASMPDVCLSPPSPPAGPVPVPYPNFAQASDTTGGTKTVKVGGKEVGMKGKSSYKKSKGDEAATRSFGANVLSHNITGPVKHKAGSFDVKVEGSGVVRFGDLTTGNHINAGGGCMTIDQQKAAVAKIDPSECAELKNNNKTQRDKTDPPPNTTITSFSVTGPRGADKGGGWACSKALKRAFDNGAVPGLERYDTKRRGISGDQISDVKDEEGRKGKKASNLCPEGREMHKGYKTTKSNANPHSSHTEARILETLFAQSPPPARGTVVTMAINWDTGGEPSDNPCPNCHRLLCAAQECGIVIALCNKKNNPKTVDEKTGESCNQYK